MYKIGLTSWYVTGFMNCSAYVFFFIIPTGAGFWIFVHQISNLDFVCWNSTGSKIKNKPPSHPSYNKYYQDDK